MHENKLEKPGFTGLPRDRASGRMLIFWNSLRFLSNVAIFGLVLISNSNVIPSLYSRIKELLFENSRLNLGISRSN